MNSFDGWDPLVHLHRRQFRREQGLRERMTGLARLAWMLSARHHNQRRTRALYCS
jgi:hypothetical protein